MLSEEQTGMLNYPVKPQEAKWPGHERTIRQRDVENQFPSGLYRYSG